MSGTERVHWNKRIAELFGRGSAPGGRWKRESRSASMCVWAG